MQVSLIVMETTTFASYLADLLNERDQTAAGLARETGLSETTISRWLRGTATPALDNARIVAEGCRRPLLEVLVSAGLITPREARQRNAAPVDLGALSDTQLLDEVRRRMGSARAAPTRADMDADPERYIAGPKDGRRTAKRR